MRRLRQRGQMYGTGYLVVALVADQSIFSEMIGESDIAAPAAHHKAAVAALDKSGGAPPVKE